MFKLSEAVRLFPERTWLLLPVFLSPRSPKSAVILFFCSNVPHHPHCSFNTGPAYLTWRKGVVRAHRSAVFFVSGSRQSGEELDNQELQLLHEGGCASLICVFLHPASPHCCCCGCSSSGACLSPWLWSSAPACDCSSAWACNCSWGGLGGGGAGARGGTMIWCCRCL